MAELADFPYFSQLPAELRLSIWEAAVSSPSMHLFDLCLPTNDNSFENTQEWNRAQTAFARTGASRSTVWPNKAAARYNKFKDTVFFDAHCSTESQINNDTGVALRSCRDPSMYRWKMALGAACFDAFEATSILTASARDRDPVSPAAVFDDAVNTVYLPGPDRRIQYNNRSDVMHICLLPQQRNTVPTPSPTVATTPSSPSSSSFQGCALQPKKSAVEAEIADSQDTEDGSPGLLDAQWSDEMAKALRNARRIALDAAQTTCFVDMTSPLAVEEMAMLACTLHQGLEVLYLVDYCPGRCQDCARPALCAKDLVQRRSGLYTKLNPPNIDDAGNSIDINHDSEKDVRTPDVIWAVDRVYREVFDLEKLGWSNRHPAFVFAQALGLAIQTQQLEATQACQFRGVRVLIAENE